jgi:cytidine deaminase
METKSLTAADETLIESAQAVTKQAFDPDHFGGAHMVGAALRTADGSVYTGVSMPASVGRASACAEPSAINAAIVDGKTDFETSVAVRHPLPDEDREFEVTSACGVCRELICDYDENTGIIFPTENGPSKARVIDLLPTRHW